MSKPQGNEISNSPILQKYAKKHYQRMSTAIHEQSPCIGERNLQVYLVWQIHRYVGDVRQFSIDVGQIVQDSYAGSLATIWVISIRAQAPTTNQFSTPVISQCKYVPMLIQYSFFLYPTQIYKTKNLQFLIPIGYGYFIIILFSISSMSINHARTFIPR